jgi:hypothetical protein
VRCVTNSSMAVKIKRRHDLFSRKHDGSEGVRKRGHTEAGTRRAVMVATMDHSSIRGLSTAVHRFFAGLPRSDNGDHPLKGCSLKIVEGSPHRCRASCCRFGVQAVGGGLKLLGDRLLNAVGVQRTCSGDDLHMPSDIPDEACEFSAMSSKPRRHIRAFTTGRMRQPSICRRSAWVSRSMRSWASLTAARYSSKAICWAR